MIRCFEARQIRLKLQTREFTRACYIHPLLEILSRTLSLSLVLIVVVH